LNQKNKSFSPVFICGSGRSGTTLVRNILGNHSNFYTIDRELHFFTRYRTYCYKLLDKFEKKNNIQRLALSIITLLFYGNECCEIMTIESNYPLDVQNYYDEIVQSEDFNTLKSKYDIFDFCINYFTHKENKKRWVEKTPRNIFAADLITERYPDAQFIEIYRDPRAVYLSWKNAEHRFFRNAVECLRAWNDTTSLGERYLKKLPKQFYRLKYEDLICSPEEELKKLCGFLNEEFEPAMLNITVKNSFFEDSINKQGFNKSSLNRWKESLWKYEVLFLDIFTKTNRKILNYPDSDVKLSFLNFLPFTVFALFTLIKGHSHFPILYKSVKNLTKSKAWCISRLKQSKRLLQQGRFIL